MKHSTSSQPNRRFRPARLPARRSVHNADHRPASSQSQESSGVVWRDGTQLQFSPDDIGLQQQPSPEPAEHRLDRYVSSDRDSVQSRRNQVHASHAQGSKTPQCQPAFVGNPRRSFIATANIAPELAEQAWSTPVIRNSIATHDAKLIARPSSSTHRADPAHPPLGRAYVGFKVEVPHVNHDENAEAPQANVTKDSQQPTPSQSPTSQVSEQRKKQFLTDPQTSEIVAAVSAAVAAVLNNQPEQQLRFEAKNLFEKKQNQATGASNVSASPGPVGELDNSYNEAMIASIAELRQTSAADAPQALTKNATTLDAKLSKEVALSSASTELENVRQQIAAFQQTRHRDTHHDNSMPADEVFPSLDSTESSSADNAPPSGGLAEQKISPAVKFNQPHEAAVPIEAAAWDVDDFRWPTITNQMIVSGGSAIEELLRASRSNSHGTKENGSNAAHRVVVSGAGPEQGTSTIAITMARTAAAAGTKTLLVDADISSPNLSQRVGLAGSMSWLNGVKNELPTAELIVRSKASNMCVMPLASTVTRVTWPRFIFDNLGQMLDSSFQHFDLIVIDAGPASQLLDELSSPGNLLDTVVLIDANSKPSELQVYQNRLKTFGVEHLILAENRKSKAINEVA